MDHSTPGFSVSSARRQQVGRSGCVVVSGVAVIIALIVTFEFTRRDERPPVARRGPVPTATVTPTVLAATVTPSPQSFSSEFTVEAPTVTPTQWNRSAAVPPVPRPSTPTPSAAACITATWDAQQTLAARATVLVNISATNRCRRVLRPTDVWFRVTGYRHGDLIQTAQGSPFREIYPGRTTQFGIGLPGSIDWYDEIRVDVFD